MDKSRILYLRLIEDYCSQRRKDAKCLKGTLFIGKAFLQAELPRIPLIYTNEFVKTPMRSILPQIHEFNYYGQVQDFMLCAVSIFTLEYCSQRRKVFRGQAVYW